MRILLVTAGFPPRIGGVETVCAELAAGLAAVGDTVHVVTFGGMRRGTERAEGSGYRVTRVPSAGGTFEVSPTLVRRLRAERFDAVHVHNLHASVAAGVWRAGVQPYLLTAHYHGSGHTRLARLVHPLYRPLAARIVRQAGRVTAVSETEARLLRRDFGVDPVVVPNGVHFEQLTRLRRRQDASRRRLLVIARLAAYKRVDVAIAALAELTADHELSVVGTGPELASLQRLATRLGVGERVHFLTERLSEAALHQRLVDADVYLNMSDAEAFSMVVLEALAAGTPVVVNNASALHEWSERFPDAVLGADSADPADVAKAVTAIDGRRVAVDLRDYQWPRIVAAYRGLYQELAA